ncbi:hypothetical protein VE01_06854 [Pseudogymnoascus verrucosus]|uniref:DH domain-containing protein n=1 Tax=Pseudogymnoascus verrucosus TaxID=342668 RepID=A0A1B8GJU8_9PEZI|nr:uncharacterized protein VE01_06854 [Pseudogymnoascus verrucosus]OBT96113.1 hypothetical protein VE01_06854 [Pseudogymnoascus verrucosus]
MARYDIQQEDSSTLPAISPRQSNPINTLKVDDRHQSSPRGSTNHSKGALGAADGINEIHITPPRRSDTPDDAEGWDTVDNITALGLAFGYSNTPEQASPTKKRFVLEELEPTHEPPSIQLTRPPFEKWVKGFNKNAARRHRRANSIAGTSVSDSDYHSLQSKIRTRHGLRKSVSGSSLGFVTAVKSASISLASFSIATKSRNRGHSSKHQKTDRSSRASNIGPRTSEDSAYAARGIANDVAVTNRSIRRRRVLEEIISTEEGYFGDVKFLMNVYVTLLASVPMLPSLRTSISRNLSDIVELHDELLGDLHRVVPHSEYTQPDYISSPAPEKQGHHRWRSLDAVPENSSDLSWVQKIPGMTAEAQVAADVAKVFGKRMHRFFAYEEYGAKYEMMVKKVASAYKTLPQWEEYQKGLEALAASLESTNIQNGQPNKSLTVGDLLVKPIQRVCRYPLLFAELLRQTPVCDCPESHMEIEKVLVRLREMTSEINKATEDPLMKPTMEKTWLLQDRLLIPDQVDPQSKTLIRSLGHVHLCGVLHVAWQTKNGVDGQHMITLLYRDCLVLATVEKLESVYNVGAIIFFNDIRIEEADNGKGIQCHTAPYSWKIVFECDHQLFEIIFSACSSKEELEWRNRLNICTSRDHTDSYDQAFMTTVSLGIKSLGTVFGKPGTVARKLSIRRATTVGPKSPLCQVIIKNTSATKDTATPSLNAAVNRSQSLLGTNRIPVLAPSRAERVRLERLLSDVWTKQILPYPGMSGRARSEHIVRSSASSMMRKLSVASITSNFAKLSGSAVSPQHASGSPGEDNSDRKVVISDKDPGSPARSNVLKTTANNIQPTTSINDLDLRFDSTFDEKMASLAAPPVTESSPIGTMKRLAALRVKNVLQPDKNRHLASPPSTPRKISLGRKMMRSVSGGSVGGHSGSPLSQISRESENQTLVKLI